MWHGSLWRRSNGTDQTIQDGSGSREAQARPEETIDVDELDDLTLDAGDNLEAEILAELEDAEKDGQKG